MNRQDVVKALTEKAGLPHTQAQNALETVFQLITKEMKKKDGEVILRGLGRFRHRESADGKRSVIVFSPGNPENAKSA